MHDILITGVLHPSDPRGGTTAFDASRAIKISRLLNRGARGVVCKEAEEPGTNLSRGRFVLTIKKDRNKHSSFQAEVCCTGPHGRGNGNFSPQFHQIRQHSVRMLIPSPQYLGITSGRRVSARRTFRARTSCCASSMFVPPESFSPGLISSSSF